MNKSFSKIRHIQEANQNLEKRTIIEQRKNMGSQPAQVQQTTGQTDGGKAELVQVLIDKINNMSKDPKFNATSVAQVVYNTAAHYMNKTDIFNDQNKYGNPFSTQVPFAPQK